MYHRNEAARVSASDELPCPASEWITPFLIHNRLYRFPCESVSVISVPSTPSTVTVSEELELRGIGTTRVEDQSTVWQNDWASAGLMPASSNAASAMSAILRSGRTLTVGLGA